MLWAIWQATILIMWIKMMLFYMKFYEDHENLPFGGLRQLGGAITPQNTEKMSENATLASWSLPRGWKVFRTNPLAKYQMLDPKQHLRPCLTEIGALGRTRKLFKFKVVTFLKKHPVFNIVHFLDKTVFFSIVKIA